MRFCYFIHINSLQSAHYYAAYHSHVDNELFVEKNTENKISRIRNYNCNYSAHTHNNASLEKS